MDPSACIVQPSHPTSLKIALSTIQPPKGLLVKDMESLADEWQAVTRHPERQIRTNEFFTTRPREYSRACETSLRAAGVSYHRRVWRYNCEISQATLGIGQSKLVLFVRVNTSDRSVWHNACFRQFFVE